ncbi:uncharacterized protein KGF55_005592 [Candida pseudojiufengensis]|uniref:uncharacterized protein n=1 Tax=Candida pseudojiufengensis TaxID=497109 RepID=UPI002224A3FA|nr:uncharacterized protein KGF55_005592 [Candida pseudojiufengensis]KAI5959101.1 hypothetical protein KGF55_005592 [Candida pseudojiufengensis]
MRANSTQISNRIFKSQRFMILIILTIFIVLLIITGISGHHQKILNNVTKFSTKASDKLNNYYDLNDNNKNLKVLNNEDLSMEENSEFQEEEDKLKEIEESNKEKGKENEKSKGKLNEIDPKVKEMGAH